MKRRSFFGVLALVGGRRALAAHRHAGNLVLVTHDVNIRALVGEYASQGEMIVALVQPGGTLRVVGRLPGATVG